MAQAGQIVRAVDFTPVVYASLSTQFTNFSTSDFEPTEPGVALTFIAPSSGVVRLAVSERLNADDPNERIRSDVEIRITDAEGTVVHSPTVTDAQGIHMDFPTEPDAGLYATFPGWRYVSGLEPGQTYWVQLQHNTAGMNLEAQNLIVEGIW